MAIVYMTKVPDSLKDTSDVEITPEMIEAGAAYVLECYPSNGMPILGFEEDQAEQLVRKILLRMGFRLADDCFPNDDRKAVELTSGF